MKRIGVIMLLFGIFSFVIAFLCLLGMYGVFTIGNYNQYFPLLFTLFIALTIVFAPLGVIILFIDSFRQKKKASKIKASVSTLKVNKPVVIKTAKPEEKETKIKPSKTPKKRIVQKTKVKTGKIKPKPKRKSSSKGKEKNKTKKSKTKKR